MDYRQLSPAGVPSGVVGDTATDYGRRVRRRRDALGLTQAEAAARSGGRVSPSQWRVIEAGTGGNYRERTLRGVEQALGWPTGGASGNDRITQLEESVQALRREVTDLAMLVRARPRGDEVLRSSPPADRGGRSR